MAVNLHTPAPEQLLPVAGVRLGVAEAGIRKAARRDLTLIELASGSRCAGVFTRNRFCAAPVQLCKEHLAAGGSEIRMLVINTGNANAGTGEPGLANARLSCEQLASVADVSPQQVLPFSTGVIGEPLPVDKIVAALPAALADLRADNWLRAAQGIMTTDTRPKATSRQVQLDGRTVTITGISKGAGMIKPNMATMLGYVATDAGIAPALLQDMLTLAVERSFNRITVDGDTSTNDAVTLVATGTTGAVVNEANRDRFQQALDQVCRELAQAIVRDGEGATKFITIAVEGGASSDECLAVGYTVAESPLVKTALYASDPNWGRILAAIGRAGVSGLDVDGVSVWLDEVLIAENGGRAATYTEQAGQAVMDREDITIRIHLGRGEASETLWTCDFSHEYVTINAEYRT